MMKTALNILNTIYTYTCILKIIYNTTSSQQNNHIKHVPPFLVSGACCHGTCDRAQINHLVAILGATS